MLKIDIDGCECHLLSILMRDPYYHAKVIQVELNHHIMPPISYKGMCRDGDHGRNSNSLDVWGCSIQAAYDVLKPYGYDLLQFDWPDGVFLHESYAGAFPCLPLGLERNFNIGYAHARTSYSRWPWHQTDKQWIASLPVRAAKALSQPQAALLDIFERYKAAFVKKNLWIEMSVSGSGVGANVTRNQATGQPELTWRPDPIRVTKSPGYMP